jgi:hypothetical protein
MRDQLEVIVKLRPYLVAIGAAATLGGTGAVVLPGVASARVVTHTVTLTSVLERQVNFSRNKGILDDRDLNKAGRVVGFDTVRFSFSPKTGRTSFGVALNLQRGFVYGVLTQHGNNPVMRGKILWGAGLFHRVAGTITARNLNKSGSRTAVTIRYHRR